MRQDTLSGGSASDQSPGNGQNRVVISAGRGRLQKDAADNGKGRRSWAVLAIVAFVLVVVVLSFRAERLMNVPGDPNYREWALQDFRDAVYYPVVCFLNHGNPYDSAYYYGHYPVLQPFLPYSPMTLLVYLPFGLLPHNVSQILFFGITILMTLALTNLTLRVCGHFATVAGVFGLSALVLMSRPGHWNLMLGQTTLPLVIAVYAALYLGATSTWASGLALAVATLKPTFGIPLIVMMLFLRHYRPVVIGTLVSGLATLVPTAILVRSAGGFAAFWHSILDGYTSASGVSAASITRIDAVALIGRLSGKSPGPILDMGIMFLLLGVAGTVMNRVRQRAVGEQADIYCIAVASIAILISVYQLSYAALLLVLPLTALALNRWVPVEFAVKPVIRVVLMILLMIPMVNYAASFGVAGQFKSGSITWLVLTSINGFAVLLAFCIYAVIGFRASSRSPLHLSSTQQNTSLRRACIPSPGAAH